MFRARRSHSIPSGPVPERWPHARGANTFGLSRRAGTWSRRLDQLGLPRFDIFTARSQEAEISYCIAGDAEAVLGPLAASSLSEVRR